MITRVRSIDSVSRKVNGEEVGVGGWRLGVVKRRVILAAAAIVLSTGPFTAAQTRNASRIDYARQIRPLIEQNCLECHSQDKRKGGLSLATYDDILEGGRNGAIVRPGNSARSTIIDRLTGRLDPQMPKDEDPLSRAQIALFRTWIDQGARPTPSSPPAPQPWEAPLGLTRPALSAPAWPSWTTPIDA